MPNHVFYALNIVITMVDVIKFTRPNDYKSPFCLLCAFQKANMSYFIKFTKIKIKSNNVDYTWIESCLCGISASNVYVTSCSPSMGDMVCNILYVLDFSH